MSIYLSASSITDFVYCPQRVLYRLNKRVIFPITPTPEMIMGEVIHKVIERYWSDRNEAVTFFKKLAQETGLPSKTINDYAFKLDLFFLNFQHYLTPDDSVEYSFKIPLYDDVFLVGKMDRISKGRIFDWKTGKVSKHTYKNIQCIIYEYAYEKLFRSKPLEINLASMADGALYPYFRNEFYVEGLFEKLIPNMIKTIRDESYSRIGVYNNSCFKCSYRKGCLKEA